MMMKCEEIGAAICVCAYFVHKGTYVPNELQQRIRTEQKKNCNLIFNTLTD